MVPHSSICAKPKWNKISKSIPFCIGDRLYGYQFARLERNRAHLQKPADKIFPRRGQPQGIRPPQTCADRRTLARGRQESPAVAQLRRYQQGFAKYARKKEADYRKKLLRPQHRTTERLTSPTAASAKAYFWRCGLTRDRWRGVPQATGANRRAQRPAAYRALQKVMSVYRRRHPKDNMQC